MKLIIDIPEEVKQAFDCAERNDLKGGYYDCGGVIGNAIRNGTQLPKGHGRLIDADALADKLQEVSVIQRYEDVKIDHRCTVADVLTSLTHDLKGTALLGYELCPTIIEADKGE